MNNATATLKSTTAITPPFKQDIVPDKRGIADLMQLAAKLSRQPQADPQTPRSTEVRVAREKPQAVPAPSGKQTLADLRIEQLQQLERTLGAVESRLTPVQKGELARLRDTLPADTSSSAPATSSNNSLALTQDRLTPVQQGEQARTRELRAPAATASPAQGGRVLLQQFGDTPLLHGGGVQFSDGGFGVPDITPEHGGGASPILGDGAIDYGSLPGTRPVTPAPPSSGSTLVTPPEAFLNNTYYELNEKVTDYEFAKLLPPPTPSNSSNRKLVTDPADSSNPVDLIDNILFGEKSKAPWAVALRNFNAAVDNSKPNPELGGEYDSTTIFGAFSLGVLEGTSAGLSATGSAIAKLAFNSEQFRLDNSIVGYEGDALRTLPGLTNRLPAWLDQLIPSHVRADTTLQYTAAISNNIAAYVKTRAENPSLLASDIKGFLSSQWDSLKADHAKAAATGSAAEARWWGKTIGRAGYEIAQTVTAVADIVKIGKAVAGFAALGIAKGVALTSAKLGEISKFASDIIDFTKLATNDGTLGLATLDDMEELASRLDEAADLGPGHYGTTAEGQAAYNKIVEADEAVNQALHKIKTPSAPYSEGNPDVYLSPKNQSWLNDLESTTKSIKYKNSSRIEFNSPVGPPQLKDLVRLTSHTGREFSLFKQGDTYVLIKGRGRSIDIDPAFVNRMVNDKAAGKPWEWVAHSHSGHTFGNLYASAEDQNLLRRIGQEKSTIVNSRGHKAEFTQNDDQSVGPSHISVKKFTTAEAFYQATNERSKILANTRYEFEGYYWETDSHARTEYAGGLASREVAGREHGSLQTTIGKQGRKGDVGFHLIADRNNGPINYLNIVPANGKINNGAYKRFENAYNNILSSGTGRNEVRFNIRLKYDDGNLTTRPDDISLKYSSRQPSGLWSEGRPLNFNNRT